MLNKQVYDRLGETIYQTTLANGLKVILMPKAGFHKTFAIMTTDYGSTDNEFVPRGQTEPVRFPDGIDIFWNTSCLKRRTMTLLTSLASTVPAPMSLPVLRRQVNYFQRPVI